VFAVPALPPIFGIPIFPRPKEGVPVVAILAALPEVRTLADDPLIIFGILKACIPNGYPEAYVLVFDYSAYPDAFYSNNLKEELF